MTSVIGLVGFPKSLSYSVSRAGLAQLTRQVAADLGLPTFASTGTLRE